MQGYNPWNAFHADINETVVLETIDLMAKLGLVEAGYRYFNLDGARSRFDIFIRILAFIKPTTASTYPCPARQALDK